MTTDQSREAFEAVLAEWTKEIERKPHERRGTYELALTECHDQIKSILAREELEYLPDGSPAHGPYPGQQLSNEPMLEGLSDIEKLAHDCINEWYINKSGQVSAETEVRCMTFNQFYNRLTHFGRKVAGVEYESGYLRGQAAVESQLDVATRALADTKRMLNEELERGQAVRQADREAVLEEAAQIAENCWQPRKDIADGIRAIKRAPAAKEKP